MLSKACPHWSCLGLRCGSMTTSTPRFVGQPRSAAAVESAVARRAVCAIVQRQLGGGDAGAARQLHAQGVFGEEVAEDWTLYPRGKPTTMTLHGTGVSPRRWAAWDFVSGGGKDRSLDGSMVRGVEVLRHTSLWSACSMKTGTSCFTTRRCCGRLLPRRSFESWFPETWQTILRTVSSGDRYRRAACADGSGDRWHLVEAQAATDPLTGKRASCFSSSMSQRRQAENWPRAAVAWSPSCRARYSLSKPSGRDLALSAPVIDVGRGIPRGADHRRTSRRARGAEAFASAARSGIGTAGAVGDRRSDRCANLDDAGRGFFARDPVDCALGSQAS